MFISVGETRNKSYWKWHALAIDLTEPTIEVEDDIVHYDDKWIENEYIDHDEVTDDYW